MKKRVLFFTVTSLVIFQNATAQKALAALPVAKHPFIVVAHRGDHVDAPENTIAAYELGIQHGVDFVEIDLRTTKDSQLVIMHDATVNRMTNGNGKVSDLSFAEIRQLKLADKTRPGLGEHQVPSFEEVLKVCRGKIGIYLDYKNAKVEQAYQLIQQYKMEKDIVVYINTPQQFIDWRRVAPNMPLMISLPDNIKTAEALTKFLQTTPVEILDGDYSDYTPEILAAAIKAGSVVWPDIQSPQEAGNWDKAISIGLKGLQTDHPAALIHYLEQKGLR